jgi:hypothetical protein
MSRSLDRISRAEIEHFLTIEAAIADWAAINSDDLSGSCSTDGYRWLEQPDDADSIDISAFLDRCGEVSS